MKTKAIAPRIPSLDEATRDLDISGNGNNRILPDAIKAVFDDTNMNQRTVLTSKLANAIIRAEAYARFYDDKEALALVQDIKQIVVSFGGKGRRDMRETIASALGMAIRTSSTPTDLQLGMKRDG